MRIPAFKLFFLALLLLAGQAVATIPFAQYPFGAYLLTDASGNGNNLTAQGTITYNNNACIGQSIGPESGVNYPTDTLGTLSAALSGLTAGTIEFSITTTAAAIAGQGVPWFIKYNGGNFYLQILNSGKIEVVNIPGGIWVLDSVTALGPDECHLITFTWNGTNERIAIDGVVDAVAANGFTMGTVSQFAIGNYLPLPNLFPWLGQIADMSLAAQAQLPTVTSTQTQTFTRSPTPTITQTFSLTPTPTLTVTKTITITHSLTPTLTATRTATFTLTPTRTPSPTPTLTATRTASRTLTSSPTPTKTVTRTVTLTPTRTITLTRTPTQTFTNTPVIPTATRTWIVRPPSPPFSMLRPSPATRTERRTENAELAFRNCSPLASEPGLDAYHERYCDRRPAGEIPAVVCAQRRNPAAPAT